MKVSEYVSLGHPDKTADYISEYILDRLIEQDSKTRYGLEVQVKDNYVTLGGEITTNAKKLKYKKWVKEAIEKIGYTHEYAKKWGKNNCLDASKVKVATHISKQSHDIAIGVDENKNQGWGDQGQFWGYSSNVPLFKNMGFGYYVAKMLAQSLYNEALHSNYFGLDIKTQVTTDDTDTIVRKIVVAIPTLRDKQVTETFVKEVICDVQNVYVGEILGSDDDVYRIDDFENIELIVNGTGAYVTHSSIGDCGTTGRKLAVDFYGGDCIIGGGCVDGETEYISENGWKKIKDYNGGKIGQISSQLKLEFVNPENYIKTFHENVYEIKTDKTTNMVLSDNHNVLYITSKGHLNKKRLSDILYESSQTKYGSHIDIPVTFTYDFSNGKKSKYNDIISRIIIAHCADGTVLKYGSKQFNCRIRIKKDYKIERLRTLFSKSNMNYEERIYSDGYTYFYYYLENTSKLLSEQFNNPDYNTAKILSEEVFWWDGSVKEKCFRTKKEKDADFIQFILSSVNGDFYSKLKHKTNDCYIIRKVNKKTTTPFRKNKTNSITKLTPQDMYCFTVPSGMLLLRRNGYIFCTGNSPWTKDSTKADLTLNMYARELAVAYGKKYKKPVRVSIGCCIGRSDLDITVYDDANKRLLSYSTKITPLELTNRYNLQTPIYAYMCKQGIISYMNELQEADERILANV